MDLSQMYGTGVHWNMTMKVRTITQRDEAKKRMMIGQRMELRLNMFQKKQRTENLEEAMDAA